MNLRKPTLAVLLLLLLLALATTGASCFLAPIKSPSSIHPPSAFVSLLSFPPRLHPRIHFCCRTIRRSSRRLAVSLSSSASSSSSSPRPISSEGWPHNNKFPAQEHCSRCGLCETTFVTRVTEACAFLPELGMARLDELEMNVHGRARRIDDMVGSRNNKTSNLQAEEEARFGVRHDDEPVRLARGIGMPGAQWTGVVTSIALAMLESGQVDAVVCIAAAASSDDSSDHSSHSKWNVPEPILAKTRADVLRGRGVKPALAPSLRVLDEIRGDPTVKRLLFCGVGCAVQAFRVVQDDLGLEQVYVLGTHCADNSPTPEAAERFLRDGVGVGKEATVRGYEFMQDYRVHVKTTTKENDEYITKPYFSLPGTIAEPSIAKSCLSCFDYTNGLADVVVGYMGAPLTNSQQSTPPRMDQCDQTLTVRNPRGAFMVQTAVDAGRLAVGNVVPGDGGGSWLSHERLASATVESDALVQAMMVGGQVREQGMPVWMGEILAFVLRATGPTGMSFARYSIDYHILRNYLYVLLQHQLSSSPPTTASSVEDKEQATSAVKKALPEYAKRIVDYYLETDQTFRSLEAKVLERGKS